jgi:hypothetical protein
MIAARVVLVSMIAILMARALRGDVRIFQHHPVQGRKE